MVNAIDCATKLNATSAKALANQGVTHVGRYLGHNWKGIEKEEADSINMAGLKIISIFEKAPTKGTYFTAAQGKSDALEAVQYAKELGQPEGTAIYFAVDYDAQQRDFSSILNYFMAVKANLKGYKLGAYGSYYVLTYLQSTKLIDYYFQTYAWSSGKRCSFNHIYQFQNGKTLAGIQVDFDNLEQSEVGAWGMAFKQSIVSNTKSPNMYRLIKGNDVFDTSVPVNVYAKLKDGYRVESIPNDKAMSQGMIRLVNASGDVQDTGDIAKVNALIAAGYVVVFHS